MRCIYTRKGHKGFIRRQRHANRRPLPPVIGLHRAASVLSAALLTSLVGIGATPAAAATCASLAGLVLPDTTITAAQSIAAGTYTAPDGEVFTDLPAFCRIAATLTPTSDSDIKIEVWMPYSGWNGRYMGTGNGNIGGLIVYGSLASFLALSYAVANTDLGTSPAATDPLRGRVLTGGGQGMHEALQFPGDYDGIVAGAPSMNKTHESAASIWNYAAFNRSPVNITAAQATAITGAIVKQCAGKDGGLSSDNFLTDPRDCHWDPAALQCTGGAADAATCLTVPQVAAMRKFYEGPIDPRTGERIYAGNPQGSENNSGFPAAFATLGQQAALKWAL